MSEEVIILGWKTLDEIKEVYAKSHLFIMPSKAEGMSVAIIEAMASGLYVLTSNEANKYKLVKNKTNGFIIKNTSAQSIANEILTYYNDFFLIKTEIPAEEIQELIVDYNWDSIGERYFEELVRIVKD